ncbi:MAG: twin-arginine translocation signal domain-containing protein, partial [Candidatus Hydrogenedentes bacterium]|nr:twin-arginine translocation signal domain-containing protein [Candidatus Hydrogenedentota bacterium]
MPSAEQGRTSSRGGSLMYRKRGVTRRSFLKQSALGAGALWGG